MSIMTQIVAGLFAVIALLLIVAGVLVWATAGEPTTCPAGCDIDDIVTINHAIIGALMVFGGSIVLFVVAIWTRIRSVETLLTKQVEQAEKTNRALAAIYKGRGLV